MFRRTSIAFLLVAAFLVTGCDGISFSNEVTRYLAKCDPAGKFTLRNCYALGKTHYRIRPETNQVVYWDDGFFSSFSALKNCAIRDAENWSCIYSDFSGAVVVRDGLFNSDKSIISPSGVVVSVRAYQWWLIRFGLGKGSSSVLVPRQFQCKILKSRDIFCIKSKF